MEKYKRIIIKNNKSGLLFKNYKSFSSMGNRDRRKQL